MYIRWNNARGNGDINKYLDFEKLKPKALEAWLTLDQREELYESDVFNKFCWTIIATKMSLECSPGSRPSDRHYMDYSLIDFSQEKIDWNNWITIQTIKSAWIEHILTLNMALKLKEKLLSYDYIHYHDLSKDDKINIAKEFVIGSGFEWEVSDEILLNILYNADRIGNATRGTNEPTPLENADIDIIQNLKCIDQTIAIAKEWLELASNKLKTIELIEKNKDILHYWICFFNWLYQSESMHYLHDRIVSVVKHWWNVMIHENDESLTRLLGHYLLVRITSIGTNLIGIYDNDAKENFSTWKEFIKKYIKFLPEKSRYFQIITVAYLVFIQTKETDEIQWLFWELHNKIKENSKFGKDDFLILLLKQYLDDLFTISFLDKEKRENRINNNKDKLLEIIPEDGLEQYINPYIIWPDLTKTADEKQRYIRSKYKICVIGAAWSIKSFEAYRKDKSNTIFFHRVGINIDQFEVRCREFKQQAWLKISRKFILGSFNIIIAFETDHKTPLQENRDIIPQRIFICGGKWQDQHFTKNKFEKTMEEALMIYERTEENKKKLLSL